MVKLDLKSEGLAKYITNVSNMLDKFRESIEETYYPLDEGVKEYLKTHQPKLKKKERKKLAFDLIHKDFPEFTQALNEIDLVIDGIGWKLDEVIENLETRMEKLEEIESLKRDLENME